jgi:hypothetical protein
MAANGRWDAVTAIANVLLAGTALWALGFTYLQIKQSSSQAQVENLMKQQEKFFDRAEMRETRRTLACSRLTDDHKRLKTLDVENAPSQLYEVIDFFETVGLLTRENALDANDVWTKFGYWINNYDVDARPVILQDRAEGAPYWDAPFTDLADSTKEIARKNKGAGRFDQESLLAFYQDECKSLSSTSPPIRHKKIPHNPSRGPTTE